MLSLRTSSWALMGAVALSGCGGSGCNPHGRKAGGDVDYVRCMAVDPPEATSGAVGGVAFAVEGRKLTLTGLGSTVGIAAFRGAGEAVPGLADAVKGVLESAPSLVFVVGGLGETEASATAHLTALAALGRPVVVLLGGEDEAEAAGAALDAATSRHANLFDGRRLREVQVGAARFVLLSGAPEGRYATSEVHCGNDEDDRDELEEADTPTFLVSWAAPSGGGPFSVSRGFSGVDAGDREVEALATRLGGVGGLFAVPGTRPLAASNAAGDVAVEAGRASPDLRLVVPRIAGAPDEREDLSLAPLGAALLELRGAELAYVGAMAGGAP